VEEMSYIVDKVWTLSNKTPDRMSDVIELMVIHRLSLVISQPVVVIGFELCIFLFFKRHNSK